MVPAKLIDMRILSEREETSFLLGQVHFVDVTTNRDVFYILNFHFHFVGDKTCENRGDFQFGNGTSK